MEEWVSYWLVVNEYITHWRLGSGWTLTWTACRGWLARTYCRTSSKSRTANWTQTARSSTGNGTIVACFHCIQHWWDRLVQWMETLGDCFWNSHHRIRPQKGGCDWDSHDAALPWSCNASSICSLVNIRWPNPSWPCVRFSQISGESVQLLQMWWNRWTQPWRMQRNQVHVQCLQKKSDICKKCVAQSPKLQIDTDRNQPRKKRKVKPWRSAAWNQNLLIGLKTAQVMKANLYYLWTMLTVTSQCKSMDKGQKWSSTLVVGTTQYPHSRIVPINGTHCQT